MSSVLLWHKGKWFGPNWANKWQQVFPDTIFTALSPTLTLLVCSTEPWWEGEIVCRLNKEFDYTLCLVFLFLHYLSMRALDRQLKGQWSNCHSATCVQPHRVQSVWLRPGEAASTGHGPYPLHKHLQNPFQHHIEAGENPQPMFTLPPLTTTNTLHKIKYISWTRVTIPNKN